MTNTVAILLPGTTVVVDTLDNGDVSTALTLLEEPALAPQQPVGWGNSSQSYGSLQAYFEQKGFASALVTSTEDLPATLAPQQLLGFAYDWRKDNRTTAGRPVAGTHRAAAKHGKLPESPDVQAYIGSIMNL
jgi:uncharacterized protein (DUF1800 family)